MKFVEVTVTPGFLHNVTENDAARDGLQNASFPSIRIKTGPMLGGLIIESKKTGAFGRTPIGASPADKCISLKIPERFKIQCKEQAHRIFTKHANIFDVGVLLISGPVPVYTEYSRDDRGYAWPLLGTRTHPNSPSDQKDYENLMKQVKLQNPASATSGIVFPSPFVRVADKEDGGINWDFIRRRIRANMPMFFRGSDDEVILENNWEIDAVLSTLHRDASASESTLCKGVTERSRTLIEKLRGKSERQKGSAADEREKEVADDPSLKAGNLKDTANENAPVAEESKSQTAAEKTTGQDGSTPTGRDALSADQNNGPESTTAGGTTVPAQKKLNTRGGAQAQSQTSGGSGRAVINAPGTGSEGSQAGTLGNKILRQRMDRDERAKRRDKS
ncbi:uncharacterized protein BXZ73DRAFT_79080 [Epithele typhae]|uniref:uncharacterized protein n=1 Tax=Epithele typhae TaxID=378194 RepID=UPI002007A499|nr:uncharacterized protein BXZ73DRAFT_79080 [Epithele typhae]KAH9925431.1 hypothetical protein BXZ73DRAFT_79080 [Epithele typhae]